MLTRSLAAAALVAAGCTATAVYASAKALAQLAAQAGGPQFTHTAPPAASGRPVEVPPGGFEQQNQAWNELVRPLADYAQRLDALDREFDSFSRALLASSLPGNSLWGKDIVERAALKGRVNGLVEDMRAEQRIREAAYALAWRLYCRGESARLDDQGRALAEKSLRRLLAPEKDLSALIEKLRSFRQGQPGMISKSLDSAISQGLDAMLAADAQIRRTGDATRRIMPAPAQLGKPVLEAAPQWRPVQK